MQNLQEATATLNATINSLTPRFNTIATNLEQATDTVKHQPWRLIYPVTKSYPDARAAPASQAISCGHAPPDAECTPRRGLLCRFYRRNSQESRKEDAAVPEHFGQPREAHLFSPRVSPAECGE